MKAVLHYTEDELRFLVAEAIRRERIRPEGQVGEIRFIIMEKRDPFDHQPTGVYGIGCEVEIL